MDELTRNDRSFTIGNAVEALDALTRHAGDCVKIVDLDGRIVGWNGACEELYGWSADEAMGEVLPHVPPELRLRALSDLRRISASGRPVERDAEAQRADGTRVSMRLTVVPLLDEDGHAAGVLSTARQLSSDRRLERQRDRFVAFVSERLRDPLAAVLGSAQLLARAEILADPERRDATLSALTACAQEASTLVEDLLVVSELLDGRLTLEPAPLQLPELVSDVLSTAHPRHGLVEFDPQLPLVAVDRARLAQAISALLGNAVRRASRPEAVTVSVFISGDDAVVEVSDDGDAPLPGAATDAGDPFGAGEGEQASLAEVMGLYLARHIAEAHGGGLHVSDLDGGPTTYSLFVPLDHPPTE